MRTWFGKLQEYGLGTRSHQAHSQVWHLDSRVEYDAYLWSAEDPEFDASSPISSPPVSAASSGGWLSSRNLPFNGIPIPRDAPVFVLPQYSVFPAVVSILQYLQKTTILDGKADVALHLENSRRKKYK